MTNDPSQHVETTLTFRKRQRTYIDPASYCPDRLNDFDPLMTGSVAVTLANGSFRVPAFKHPDGSVETAAVVTAQLAPSMTPRVAALVLASGHPEQAVVWWPAGEEPLGSTRVRLTVTDKHNAVRLLPEPKPRAQSSKGGRHQ